MNQHQHQRLFQLMSMLSDNQLELFLQLTEQKFLETPSTELPFASPELTLPGLVPLESTEEPGSSTSPPGTETEEAETRSPIRTPSKKESRLLFEAIEATLPGPRARKNSDSPSSPENNKHKPDDSP